MFVPTSKSEPMPKSAKNLFRSIGNGLKKIGRAVTPPVETVKPAAITILLIAVLAHVCFDFSVLFKSIGFFYAAAFVLLFLLMVALAALLLNFLIPVVSRIPPLYRLALLFVLLLVLYLWNLHKAYGWLFVSVLILFPSLLGGGIGMLRKHGWSALAGKQRTLTALSVLTGLAGLIIAAVWFLQPGPTVKQPANASLLSPPPPRLNLPDPSAPGKYEVQFLTYGNGKDRHRQEYGKRVGIVTPSVDASLMLKSWDGFTGKLRTWYFGFDNKALPLNARVWYPKGNGPFPLVLIVHGNHLAQDYSDPGYEYIGKLMASKGYIVASVDENFLNGSFTDFSMFKGGLKNENGTRGWLLLKHLQLWRKWNADPASKFFHHVDMDRIAIIGHSRGGEAVGHAALFNRLPYFPDDANEVFDFNFNIRAVIAIAPVDGQYKPAGILVPLRDINYFVYHGSHDMDMQSYGGMATWHRIKYSPAFRGFKAGLYIYRANHGQFNSSWGRKDNSSPDINKFNLKQLMPEEDQQKIAKVYMSAFLEATLKDSLGYKPLFMDYRTGRQWLPKGIYLNQFQAGGTDFLATYDEDLDLATTTVPGGHITAQHLTVWHEQQNKLMWDDQSTRSVYIGWNRKGRDTLPGSYTLTLPDSLAARAGNKLLVFSLAQSTENSSPPKKGALKDKKHEDEKKKEEKKKEDNPINLTIELTDNQGKQVSFPLSECSYLQPQIKKHLTKLAFLNDYDDSEGVSGFFYFDLKQLVVRNPAFNSAVIKQVRFIFDKNPAGVVVLDDLGFQ